MTRAAADGRRRYPIGAEVLGDAVHVRVWAPASETAGVVLVDAHNQPLQATQPLTAAGDYFEGLVDGAHAGSRYWIELGNGRRYPDPASRFQPEGPHGPSEVIDHATFDWTDAEWGGAPNERIVYELHVGTFTQAGTWAAAVDELAALSALGISIIEVLPIAEFPGQFGWGYDGVLPFAPTRLYGRPDELRRFVDAAHHHGIAVILDVVYNHMGPDGCHLKEFSPAYFAHSTEWGEGLNFDGQDSAAVREYVTVNARYWIDEFHFDGLRLDAAQSIHDRTHPHILADIARVVRTAAGSKRTWLVAEHEPQHPRLIRRPEDGGYGLDALWNEDFHHAAMVALTGRREAYYTDYRGEPQEFVSAAKRGFLYQGQWYSWQKQPRGENARGLMTDAFVAFLQNHDQVANSPAGERLHKIASPGKCRALTALLLLGPWTPMLFQGQEFESSSRFLYFADHQGELRNAVEKGRWEFLSQFPSLAGPAVSAIPDPGSPDTFAACKIDHRERDTHTSALALHQSLLALRRADPAFHDRRQFSVDGAVLDAATFVLRYMSVTSSATDCDADRLLVVNLGVEKTLPIVPEPLLSPHPRTRWTTIWSSEDPMYGGPGMADLLFHDHWRLPPECAIVLAPDQSS